MPDPQTLDQSLSSLITKLEAAGDKLAAPAFDAALRAIRWEAAVSFLGCLVCALVIFGLYRSVRFLLPHLKEDGVAVCCIGIFLCTIFILCNLLSAENWMGLFDPTAALASKVLH